MALREPLPDDPRLALRNIGSLTVYELWMKSPAGDSPDTNRRNEARAALSEIYNWFTEGFHTAD